MSTRDLAFGGVICALSSICIIISSLFHLISPLAVCCALYCLCEAKSGKACAVIVIFTSNLIGFLIGGIGGGEILYSFILFSPFAIIIFCTNKLRKGIWQILLRALLFAIFSALVYVLFATLLKEVAGFDIKKYVAAMGVAFVAVMTMFGFALDRFTSFVIRRIKSD